MKPTLSKGELRVRRYYLFAENRKYGLDLVKIPRTDWARIYEGAHVHSLHPRVRMRDCWRSYRFLVQVFDEPNGIIRISVNRTHLNGDGGWMDDIKWDDLQAIKNAIGFGDRDAVEMYPPEADVVNVANIRHLWVLPEKLSFGWREKTT